MGQVNRWDNIERSGKAQGKNGDDNGILQWRRLVAAAQ